MKSKGFFLLLILFASLSFVWWTVQIYSSDLNSNRAQNRIVEIEVALAKQQVRNIWLDARLQEKEDLGWIDSARRFLVEEYPKLNLEVSMEGIDILPSEELTIELDKDFSAKRRRRIFEGSLFFAVLLTSFIWIYRSLVAAIDLNRQQNSFLLAVTHELKTPVAGIKLILETLKRGLGVVDTSEIIRQGINESNRLDELVENILIATRLQDSSAIGEKNQVDLTPLAESCVIRMNDIYPNYNWRISVPEEALVSGDEIALRLVIMNLLDNARKYSKEETKIVLDISTQPKKHKYLITISDEGKGVPEREKSKIFNKFYRVDEEIRRRSKGTGLGLFIVKEVLLMHKASVWVEDNDPQGSKFCILIPQL